MYATFAANLSGDGKGDGAEVGELVGDGGEDDGCGVEGFVGAEAEVMDVGGVDVAIILYT